MARRKDYSVRSSKRQAAPNLKRSENRYNPRLLILLACEGKNTERLYFDAFFAILKNHRTISPASCVFAPHQHTNPTGVLKDLLDFKDSAGRTCDNYEHRWIVIDRDEERHGGGGHTLEDFNEAIERASKRRRTVKVAWSNPSFELWYLLHFHFYNTAIDRDQVIKKLEIAIAEPYEKSRSDMYYLLASRMTEAIRNARRLIKRAEEVTGKLVPANTNPATTVFELVELLQELQKTVE
ncbi:MAG: RloB domain-containing protein [Erysipelotrichia bacterium]|nr:RloB domain-containing protein [Erysipelotrichia bacterium]